MIEGPTDPEINSSESRSGKRAFIKKENFGDNSDKDKYKKALCGNRRPSNDCLPYEKTLKKF
jgi:hypothetical protein